MWGQLANFVLGSGVTQEQVAREAGTPLKIIECVCSDETARQHLADSGQSHPAGNRNYQLYLELKARYEPIRLPRLVEFGL